MVGKLAELVQAETSSHGPRCTVAVIAAKLDKAERKELEAFLADSSVYGSVIAKALTKLGHPVQPSTVNRHRKQECSCGQAS